MTSERTIVSFGLLAPPSSALSLPVLLHPTLLASWKMHMPTLQKELLAEFVVCCTHPVGLRQEQPAAAAHTHLQEDDKDPGLNKQKGSATRSYICLFSI